MKKIFWMVLLFILLSGCASANAPASSSTPNPSPSPTPVMPATPTTPVATPTPSTSPESPGAASFTKDCSLLDSHDLASFYSTAEVVLPTPKVEAVNQVAFSSEKISATEVACTYYVFQSPGTTNMQMLEVDYWLDSPGQTTSTAWTQVWSQASSLASQTISGIGDGAFYENGKLTFEYKGVYVTISVTDTANNLNANTSTGTTQRIKIEKQIATDMLKHF